MRIRNLAPFAVAFAVACGGAATDDTAMADETQEYAAGDAAAAAEAVVDYWETHYNMGHASMVASTMVEDAIFWDGAGGMLFGRPAVEAQLEAEIEAASPQLDVTVDETIVADDFAVMRGSYETTGTVDGESFTSSGYWVSLAENIEGEWKIHGVVGNVGPGDQMAPSEMAAEASTMPEGAGMGAELVQDRLEYYMTHFNMGHPDMVAETYTEDAVVMGSGAEPVSGRTAAAARLAEMAEAGMQIESIDIFRARELDDTYVTAAGTYTIAGPDGEVNGHFGALYKRVDGELLLHRLLTSDHPSAM